VERIELGVPLLVSAVRDAAELGYNFLALGGDQTLFHPGLTPLCREAHQRRMLTTLTTRIGLLNPRRLRSLIRSVDLLGVRYEAGMARGLELVRHCEMPFAIVYRLTRESIGDLETAAAFAVGQGAAMLHIEPADELSDSDMATVWMIVECLRDLHRGKLATQLEVRNRYSIGLDAVGLDQWQKGLTGETRFVGDVVSPLVIEEDGTVVPLRHGFPRPMAWGNLHQQALKEMTAQWIRHGAGRFCEAYRAVLGDARRDGRAFADLHRMLALEASRSRGMGAPAAG
jgi:hypothetical protein